MAESVSEVATVWRPVPSSSDREPRRRARVISIGNLAMGGRGKTPLVAHVARTLVAAGERPAILSRGYKRRRPEEGVVIVSDGERLLADLDRSGDEPLMLARQVPGAAVLVCETRTIAAALAEHQLGATMLVLDDGFQHRAMSRDLDIVLIAPEDLTNRRLPFGTLRSPVSDLRRAHAVVVDGRLSDLAWGKVTTAVDAGRTSVFEMTRRLGDATFLEEPRTRVPRGVRVLAVAGIAQPARFTRSLEIAGWEIADTIAFSDHHAFTPRDVRRIAAAWRTSGATVVMTTEKDAVRLLPLRPLGIPIAGVGLQIDISRLEARGLGLEEGDTGHGARDTEERLTAPGVRRTQEPLGHFDNWLLRAVSGGRN